MIHKSFDNWLNQKRSQHKLFHYVMDLDDLSSAGDHVSKCIGFLGDYEWYLWNTFLYHKDVFDYIRLDGKIISTDNFTKDQILDYIIVRQREKKLKRILG